MTTNSSGTNKFNNDHGMVLTDTLVGLFIGGIILVIGVAFIVLSGKGTRIADASVVAQSKLIDTVTRMTRDVASSDPIMAATPTTLSLEVKSSDSCAYTTYQRNDDASVTVQTARYPQTICPAWTFGQPLPNGATVGTDTLLPSIKTDSPIFTYYDVDDTNITANADEHRDLIKRVEFDITAAVNERPSGVTLRTSAVPRGNSPTTGQDPTPVSNMAAPVLTACRAPGYSNPCPSASGNDAQLSWTLPTGATSYLLERADAPGQPMTIVGTYPTSSPNVPVADVASMTVQPGQSVTKLWQVLAFNGSTGQVTQSNIVSLSNSQTLPNQLSQVLPVCSKVGNTWTTQVTVIWNTSPNASAYQIYIDNAAQTFTATDTTYEGMPAKQAVFTQTTAKSTYQVTQTLPGGPEQIGPNLDASSCAAPTASCARGDGETDTTTPKVVTVTGARPWNLYAANGSDASATPTGSALISGSQTPSDLAQKAYGFTLPRGGRQGFVAVGDQPDGSTISTFVLCVSRPGPVNPTLSIADAAGRDSAAGWTDPSSNNRIKLSFPRVPGAVDYKVFINYSEPGCTSDPTCKSPFEAYKAWTGWRLLDDAADSTWTGSKIYSNWANGGVPHWATQFLVAVYAVNDSPDDNSLIIWPGLTENEWGFPTVGCNGGCPSQGTRQPGWSAPRSFATYMLHPEQPTASTVRAQFAGGPTDVRYDARVGWAAWLNAANGFTVTRDGAGMSTATATGDSWGNYTLWDRGRPAGQTSTYTVAANCTANTACQPNADTSIPVSTVITMGPGPVSGALSASWNGSNAWNLNWGPAAGASGYKVFTSDGYYTTVGGTSASVVSPGSWPAGGNMNFYVVPINSVGEGPRSNLETNSPSTGLTGVLDSKRFTSNGQDQTVYNWSVKGFLAACMDLALPGADTNPGSYGSWQTLYRGDANPKKYNATTGKMAEQLSNNEFDAVARLMQVHGETRNWTQQASFDGVLRYFTQADNDTVTANALLRRNAAEGSYADLQGQYWADALSNMAPWRPQPGGLPGFKWADLNQCVVITIQAGKGEQTLTGTARTAPVTKTDYAQGVQNQTVTVWMSNVDQQPGTLTTDAWGNITACYTPRDTTQPVVAWVTVPGTPWTETNTPGARSAVRIATGDAGLQRYFRRGLNNVMVGQAFAYNLG